MQWTEVFILMMAMCLVSAQRRANQNNYEEPEEEEHTPDIISYKSLQTEEGNFEYSFETSDPVTVQASGQPKQFGDEVRVIMQGSYSFISIDHNGNEVPVTVNWYADENGFHASGDSIPEGTGATDRDFSKEDGEDEQFEEQSASGSFSQASSSRNPTFSSNRPTQSGSRSQSSSSRNSGFSGNRQTQFGSSRTQSSSSAFSTRPGQSQDVRNSPSRPQNSRVTTTSTSSSTRGNTGSGSRRQQTGSSTSFNQRTRTRPRTTSQTQTVSRRTQQNRASSSPTSSLSQTNTRTGTSSNQGRTRTRTRPQQNRFSSSTSSSSSNQRNTRVSSNQGRTGTRANP